MKYLTIFRYQRLTVGVGSQAAPCPDIFVEALLLTLTLHKLFAEGLGQDLLGQIVAGGAEAAGGDEDIGALFCDLHALAQPLGIIAHHGVVSYIDPDL